MKDLPDPLAKSRSLTDQLRGKSRRRRDDLGRMAKAVATPRALRNDLLPSLNLAHIPLDQLRMQAREVRRLDPAHVREVANSISALGFCVPILVGKDNVVIDGEVRFEAAQALGPHRVALCADRSHLGEDEQRVLRLAVNRLGEKGEWNLDELKIEFEELILADAPIEISGFTLDEIDQIVIGDGHRAAEQGPLAARSRRDRRRSPRRRFSARAASHRLRRRDRPETLRRLMEGDPPARLVLTDEPYNVPIAGHVTGGRHREFAMASGEMTDAEFLAFNEAWMEAVLPYLCDGGVFGTFIDWRGLPTVTAAAAKLGLTPLNLIVWAKTNAGMGSLYRSQHELLPLFKKGTAPHVNNVELGKTRPLALERLDLSRRLVARLRRPSRPQGPPDRQADRDARGRAPRPHQPRRHRHRPVPRLWLDPHRRREDRPRLPRRRTRPALCRRDHAPVRGRDREPGGPRRDRRGLRAAGRAQGKGSSAGLGSDPAARLRQY